MGPREAAEKGFWTMKNELERDMGKGKGRNVNS
jgi:hypothetical protein